MAKHCRRSRRPRRRRRWQSSPPPSLRRSGGERALLYVAPVWQRMREGGKGTGSRAAGGWRPRARGGRRLSAPTPRTGDGRRQPGADEGRYHCQSERAELHSYRMFEKTATQTDRRMEREGEGVERVTLRWASAAVVERRSQAENGRRNDKNCRPPQIVARIHRKLPGCLAPSLGRSNCRRRV